MAQQREYTYSLTILLIGDTEVGKSNIFERIKPDINSHWISNIRLTPGVDLYVAYQSFDDKILRFNLWDLSGQDRYRRHVVRYYSIAKGFFLVYDITKRKSFKNILEWLLESKGCAYPTEEYILLGNRCDLEEDKQVSYEEGREFAEKHNMMFFEVSAKSGENIKHAMRIMTSKLVDLKQKENELKRAAELRKEIALNKQSQVQKVVGIFKKRLQSFEEVFSDWILFVTLYFYSFLSLLLSPPPTYFK